MCKNERLPDKNKMELLIYVIITYGVCWGIGIANYCHPFVDGSTLAYFMMLLPATGVAIGRLYKNRETGNHTNRGIHFLYIIYSSVVLCFILLKAAGIINNNISETTGFQVTAMASSVLLLLFTILGDGTLSLKSNFSIVKWDLALFLLIVFIYICIICLDAGRLNPASILRLAMTVPSFFVGACHPFGEEYGWRGFLQDKFQNRFGKRCGVLLLGIVWELWHMPLWFGYYDLSAAYTLLRFFTTPGIAVVIGYVYMKSRNVWVCSFMHFMINYSPSFISSNSIKHYSTIPFTKIPVISFAAILMTLAFYAFLLKKEYRKATEKPIETGI